jgi:HK97 family phage portal protein
MATPRLLEALQLFDGTLASYGNVYRQLTPVRTVVDFIGDSVATTPLKVYRRVPSGRPEARDHPLAVLLRSPNPDLTDRTLIWGTVADLCIYGNAYWRKLVVGNQKTLVPLPPYRVTPRGGDLVTPSAYDFWQMGAGPLRFSRDEVVHFKLYDPEDRRIGSSKLEALRNILLEEIGASSFRRGFWRNHAELEVVLKHPGSLSETAATRLATDFDNRHRGAANASRTVVLEEDMGIETISVTPKDAEFIQGREFVLEATARVFNLPLSLLGLTETATFASQREFRKQLFTEVLPPYYELIQSEIELQLMPWFTDTADLYVEFVVESKLRGDFIDQANLVFQAVGRPYMTVHEARDLFNMANRREDTDDELAIPVGPNLALESAPSPAPLASVSTIPTQAASLAAFFDRQKRSVVSKAGAGKPFDRDRWNRELASLVGPEIAQSVNLRIEVELGASHEPDEVFARAYRELIARSA